MAKTAAKIPIYYFDSCLFLSLINEEPGRFKKIEAILESADNQECQIFTSQLSVAEVSFGEQEKKGKALSVVAENKIAKLWHPSSPIQLVDVHSMISIEAKSVIRTAMKNGWTKGENWSVKPPDAIHIATAKITSANYLFTYDERLLKLKHAGVDICEPFLVQGIIGVDS